MIRTDAFAAGQENAFLTLYRACLAHYALAPATGAQEDRILDLLRRERHMACVMAYDDQTPVGFATWGLTFPAGNDTALYIKELFVDTAARGAGVGRALLSRLVDIAEAEGCARIDWQTDGDNAISQAFYARIGAPAFDKKTFRVRRAEFTAFKAQIR